MFDRIKKLFGLEPIAPKCSHNWVFYGELRGREDLGENSTIANVYECSICKEKKKEPVIYSGY